MINFHKRLLTRASILVFLAFCLTPAYSYAHTSTRQHPLPGINLAGAEFSASKIPGHYGWDYIYPNAREVRYFAVHGMKLFRVPVLWERLQPHLGGPLNHDELKRLKSLATVIHKNGGIIVIDIHDYGLYQGSLIGSSAVPVSAYTSLWAKLARQFAADDYVAFGLMNEPKLPRADEWAAIVQQTINAIRATGAKNRIMVAGTGWDGAAGFAARSGPTLGNLTDPQHRLIYEVHQYFDKDASGTSPVCIPPAQAARRLAGFTQWLREGDRRGYLGEFGVSTTPDCLAILRQTLNYMQANNDVWWGWTYWAAGPLWGHYMFSAEPVAGKEAPQMQVMEPFLHPNKANP
ncbi:MAG: glycoside hydrolase family 5 protein [Acidocella sp.]|nr:glycoside hydrolase family 5 protein [Acidocella sp.]